MALLPACRRRTEVVEKPKPKVIKEKKQLKNSNKRAQEKIMRKEKSMERKKMYAMEKQDRKKVK